MMSTVKMCILAASAVVSHIAFGSVLTIPSSFIHHPAEQNPAAERADCTHTQSSLECVRFHYNHDGDTLTVSIPEVHPLLGNKVSVRVHGIDAPERYSADPCERDAALVAQKLVTLMLTRAQRIDLHTVQRDKYFRILADVRADGESVAAALLSRGLAAPYFGGTKPRIDWCPVRSLTID